MTFTIMSQRYQVGDHAPLTYAIYVTNYPHEHDECWGVEGFVAYSWSVEGAERAVKWLMEEAGCQS